MERATRDLARMIPALVAAWRGLAGRRSTSGARSGERRRGVHGRQGFGRHGAAEARGAAADRLGPDELRTVAAGVTRLSAGLTRDRALAGARYMDDPRLLGAYLLFYWPISYLQARGVFSELPRRPGAVLDLARGPAPVAFAALDAGASGAIAADRSAAALGAARTS